MQHLIIASNIPLNPRLSINTTCHRGHFSAITQKLINHPCSLQINKQYLRPGLRSRSITLLLGICQVSFLSELFVVRLLSVQFLQYVYRADIFLKIGTKSFQNRNHCKLITMTEIEAKIENDHHRIVVKSYFVIIYHSISSDFHDLFVYMYCT